jgi:hypothetical protein
MIEWQVVNRWVKRSFIVASAIGVLLAVVQQIDGRPAGLRARYYRSSDWSGPARSTVDYPDAGSPSSAAGASALWRGSVFVIRPGSYSFETTISGASSVFIDGREAAGAVHLNAGGHAIAIRHSCPTGCGDLVLTWSRDGRPRRAVPRILLFPMSSPTRTLAFTLILRASVLAALWVALASGSLLLVSIVARKASTTSLGERGTIELFVLAASLLILYFVTPFSIEGDGRERFRVLSGFLADGELSRSPYSLVGPLASSPLWWLGRTAAGREWWCARFNVMVFVAGLFGLYRALRPELDAGRVMQFLIVLTVGSMFPHHNGRYYGEAFTSVLVAVGLAIVVMKRSFWGWVLAILGVANTPANLAGLAAVALWLGVRRRNVFYLIAIVAAAALIAGEAWIRRGSPFFSGYEGSRGVATVLPFSGRPGFSYPLVFGVISILFSFGKGIMWFAPGLLLWRVPAESSDDRELAQAWLVFLIGLVLVYARWWGWNGGDFWGPRFFLFASIPSAYFIARWLKSPRQSAVVEILGVACLLWAVWVGVNGILYGFGTPAICTADHYALEFLCWYTPEFSPLFRPLATPRGLGPAERLLLWFCFGVGFYLIAIRLRAMSRRPGVRVA